MQLFYTHAHVFSAFFNSSHSDLELFPHVVSLKVLVRLRFALRILEHKLFQSFSLHLVTVNGNYKDIAKVQQYCNEKTCNSKRYRTIAKNSYSAVNLSRSLQKKNMCKLSIIAAKQKRKLQM